MTDHKHKAAELVRVNANDLSMEGEAGQSATPSQAARGEAADGQPLRTAGGVAPELEEAGDMGTSDGLGAKDPEDLAKEISLWAAAEVFVQKAYERFQVEQNAVKPDLLEERSQELLDQAERLAKAQSDEERARLVYEARVRLEGQS